VADYEYELRQQGAVIATGRMQLDEQPAPGDTFSLGSQDVRVEDVLHLGRGSRLILERSAR